MDAFRYFMPVNTYFGRGCIAAHKEAMAGLGKKAMVVTGRSSAKKNGALQDVTEALDALGIPWLLFDEIRENPDVETVLRGARLAAAEQVDFFIGIGGGSPMDGAKAISILTANPQMGAEAFTTAGLSGLPVVAVPTTAGTGSEVTQYAVLTFHEKRTKSGITPKLFPEVSFLDSKYMDALSPVTTNNTAVDALTHLIESYLCVNSNFISEKIVEMGLSVFRECIPALKARKYDPEIRDRLLLASAIGGVAIAQTGTSLPHGLGYFPTYEKQVPHGRANGLLTQAYLELFPAEETKVTQLLACLGMKEIADLGAFLDEVLDSEESYTAGEVADYTERMMASPQKLAAHPYPLTKEDIYEVYAKSLLK